MTSVSHNNLNIHNCIIMIIIMIVKPNEKELDSETMDALTSALLALTTDDSSRYAHHHHHQHHHHQHHHYHQHLGPLGVYHG